MQNNYADELFSFIKKSPTSFHATSTLMDMLTKAGFEELCEGAPFKLERGKGYFVTRNLSSVLAFKVPNGDFSGFVTVAAHSDSPAFKLKNKAELSVSTKYVKLNTEKYGGMLMGSWFDRPLSIAGRVVVRTDDGIYTRLVNIDRDLVIIPSLAIHMCRDANDGHKFNAAKDTCPLFSLATEGEGAVMPLIAEALGIDEKDILGSELFVYNRMDGTVFGKNREFIAAPRLDDLECAFCAAKALSECEPKASMPIMYIADNEEVGSATKQGAQSSFLEDMLERICAALGEDRLAMRLKLASSLLISADNAHALHPNYVETSDDKNAPYINGGVVIKYNGSQRYCTDAVSEGMFRLIAQRAGVPCQIYANRSDMPGGSTLGNIAVTRLFMNAVDIGIAQLAMHSAYESAGIKDIAFMHDIMKACYETVIVGVSDGHYVM